jgi:hypothetical protein
MEAAESFVQRANEADEMHEIKFSQAMILFAFLVLIKRGVVNHSLVTIKFQNHLISADVDGQLSDWPHGFCNHAEDYLLELF